MQSPEPADYPRPIASLLAEAPLNALGPGIPRTERHAALSALTPEGIAAPRRVADAAMARACIAGLWLRYDHLNESHAISQSLETPAGSYWHAIMHRREGDFSNAKYWFRRVGGFPTFAALNNFVREAHIAGLDEPAAASASFLRKQSDWDPFQFVDLCEAAQSQPPLVSICRQIQQREWELLFEYCFRQAIAS